MAQKTLKPGSRRRGRPQLRYRDALKRDMKAVGIDTETWENLAADRSQWRGAVTRHLKTGEEKLTQAATRRRTRRKLRISNVQQTAYTCSTCGRDCHSRIGLHSHSRRCSSQTHNQDAIPMVDPDRWRPTMEKLIYSNNHNTSLSSPIKLYKITLCTVLFGSMSEKCKNSFKRHKP